MKDLKPFSLHFFVKEHLCAFGAVARQQRLAYEIEEVKGLPEDKYDVSYYITTEPISPTAKRNLIAAWAKASMEVIQ